MDKHLYTGKRVGGPGHGGEMTSLVRVVFATYVEGYHLHGLDQPATGGEIRGMYTWSDEDGGTFRWTLTHPEHLRRT